MTWQVGITVHMETEKVVGYTVEEQVDSFPVDILFSKWEDAKKLCDWLNKKDSYTERLEIIISHDLENGDEILEKINKQMGLRE